MNDDKKYLMTNAWLRNVFFLLFIHSLRFARLEELGPGTVGYKMAEAARSRLRMVDMRANLANTLMRRRSLQNIKKAVSTRCLI